MAEEEKKTKFCSNCRAEIDIKAKICPKCGVEQPIIPEKLSNWWYVLVIFLGFTGGLIAWAVNKDRNPEKARRFLIVGLVLPAIFIVMIILFLIILTSLLRLVVRTREKIEDEGIIANMNQIQLAAEMVYLEEGGNYSLVSCTHPKIISLCQSIETQTGKKPTIHSSQKDYCVYVKLLSGNYYCIDSKGSARKTSVYPGARYCNGRTFVCP